MTKPAESQVIASQQKSLRTAKDALRSARLTAKASKARIRALKSEVKIQRKHYKWARIQVRAAKDEVARWKAAIAAEETAPEGDDSPRKKGRDTGIDAKAEGKSAKRKHATLEVERLTLTPVLPARTDRVTPVGGDDAGSVSPGDAADAAAGTASASSRPRALS